MALLLCALGSVQPASQEPPAPPQEQQPEPQPDAGQPVFRAGISFVRVDVIVTDKQGNPVVDLKQADFEVLEDGRPQAIESFKLVRISGVPEAGAEPARAIRSDFDEQSEAARDDVRLFAIFLDDYHVRRGAGMAMRGQLARFIETQLGPLDMVALMYPLTPIDVVRLTRDHGSMIAAVQRFEGRKHDYTPRNSFEEQYSMYPATIVERIRNQVSLSALRSLITHLGGLREGRKGIILVTEGYSNNLPPQLRDPVAALPGFGNPNRNDPFAGQGSQAEETSRFFNQSDMQSDLREVYNTANRNNTALYTLDPRGLAGSEFGIEENVGMTLDRDQLAETIDTLRVLADETDGRAIVNRNDLEAGLKQAVGDSSVYYLLGYNTQAPTDGKFHEIRVRIKRPGAQVRARKGYWALTAEESARALAPPKPPPPPAVTEALSTIVEAPRSRVVRTWVGTQKAENGRTRVTFVWDPLPAVPGVTRETAAGVSLVALGPNGGAYFRGRVPEGDQAAPASSDGGGGAPVAAGRRTTQVSFDAPPGRLQLRVAVEGADGQLLDSSVQEIVVPDFTAPQLFVTTPAVITVRNGLELRSYSTNPDAPATALRDFRRTDRLLIRFGVHAPGDAPVAPTARLMNKNGQAMAELSVKPPTGGVPHQVDVPLASYPTGEYLIELKVEAAGAEAKELVAFRVIS
jgi:VWFA-related protein